VQTSQAAPQLTSLSEALATVLSALHPVEPARLAVGEADGRILAEPGWGREVVPAMPPPAPRNLDKHLATLCAPPGVAGPAAGL